VDRTVNLAVEVSWRINPCTPVLASARVELWVPSINAPESYLVRVRVPEHGLQLVFEPSGLPRELAKKIIASKTYFLGHPQGEALSRRDALYRLLKSPPPAIPKEIVDILDFAFPVLVCKQKDPSRFIKGDPLKARNAFLGLPREISALSDFLATYGTWSVGSTRSISFDNPQPNSAHSNVSVVEPEQFWRQQRSLRQAMRQGASSWISRNQPRFQFSSRKEFPHFFHEDSTCLEAITNSFTVDFMRGVRFMCCQRTDCQNIFEDSHKGKRFCSWYCGHLTSVRRTRAGAGKNAAPKRGKNGAL
jgi:hypothetical protein